MIDKESMQQILGALMKCPQLLSEVDKYNLTLYDFPSKFEKYIFSAIYGLYYNGARKIDIIDIENYLSTDPIAKKTFEVNNGIEYLQDIEEFSNVENFQYYYDKLKKFNLLNDLQKKGFDTSSIYSEDLTSDKSFEVNKEFESINTKDIINKYKKELLKLESEYASPEEIEKGKVSDNIDDFLESLSEAQEIGLPIQGNIYNQIIDGAQKGALTIRSGSSGLGKALPNSSLIPTPNGWKTVGEIKVGDYLFDAFGKPTKVLNIYPQGKKEVYQITFKDGRTVKCCEEHLWSYNLSTQKFSQIQNRNFYTATVKDIMKLPIKKDNSYNILVPQQYAVEYKEQSHYIPPYLFGLFLGDGSFKQQPSNKSFQYSSEDSFLPKYIANTMNWFLKKGSQNNYNWYFSFKEQQENQFDKINVWVEDILIEHPELINTTSQTKFIPASYLYDSIPNRFELLNGLLDSDGSVDDKGRITYYTISFKMVKQVEELCQSLGFKTYLITDNHKINIGYILIITGRPQDKRKLFKLPRKHEKIEKWFMSPKRKEHNETNPIIKIENLHYFEDMTCFYVDNKEHLFLVENFIVTHNTRQAVGDACLLAYPLRFNPSIWKWEQIGNNEKVLFIVTEQTFKQVKKMIFAYLTGFNESRFKYNDFNESEKQVINQAKVVIEQFENNFILLKVPNPTIELIKTLIREQCLTQDIGYVFYDYIFVGPALLNEFRGFNLRNDEVLLMFATALKDLAVELNVCMFTSTQVNSNADDNRNIRNEASLAGGRATINKADNGAIMARPTKEELETLQPIIENYGIPNMVTDIFKVRSGEWSQVRIWSIVDLGTMRKKDLFLTDSRLEPIDGFFERAEYQVVNWDEEDEQQISNMIQKLNIDIENGIYYEGIK